MKEEAYYLSIFFNVSACAYFSVITVLNTCSLFKMGVAVINMKITFKVVYHRCQRYHFEIKIQGLRDDIKI